MLKRASLQIIFWLIIAGVNAGFGLYFLPLKVVVLSTLFVLFFQALVFYGNAYVLFPQFFSLTHSGRFFLLSGAFVLVVTLSQTLLDYFYFSRLFFGQFPFPPPHLMMIFMRCFFWLVFIDVISTVFMMQDKIRQQAEQTQQIKAEKLNAELKLLKAQINPHFIFNTLNNIYSLTYSKSAKAPESILKLSQMLRYVLEECEREQVTLQSEIEYIESYIAFQKMKTPDELNITFDYSQAEPEVFIAPMLLIPFIENGFKYSKIEEAPSAFINIELGTTAEEISFRMANSIPRAGIGRPGAGTGIDNVRKRLDILFPQKYSLEIREEDSQFNIHLLLKRT